MMPRELSGQGRSTSPLFEERIAAIVYQPPAVLRTVIEIQIEPGN
jgi:hypothetical protein